MPERDCIVIGGGVIGAAMAYGLARRGLAVAVLDEGDEAFRASRANFGLVWVQGKGLGKPEYAQWSRRSSDLWRGLADELEDSTGIDCGFRRPGGVTLALSDDELQTSAAQMARLGQQPGVEGYEYEVLERAQLDNMLPGLGPDVVGGIYCPHDGEANSLRLLHALHAALAGLGASYHPHSRAVAIEALAGGGYAAIAEGGTRFEAAKVVIAAGLGNRALAEMVGLDIPVAPVQGQVLVTERAERLFEMPTLSVRQLPEGTFILGYSAAEVDYDLQTQPETQRDIAFRNAKLFPFLARLRVVRSWAGLRVMTPDGWPIYEESSSHPGVFVTTGHSGVTTAAVHALDLAGWIAEGGLPEHMKPLSTARFHVSPS